MNQKTMIKGKIHYVGVIVTSICLKACGHYLMECLITLT